MIAPDNFANGSARSIRNMKRNPDLDSDAISQQVGPDSSIDQIIAFGHAAFSDVVRGAELKTQARLLQFVGTLHVILALHWLKLRIDDHSEFVRAAKQVGVGRTYAYDLLKLRERVPELRAWGETHRKEHGEYPSLHAMMGHCGIGLGRRKPWRGRSVQRDRYIERMQRQLELLRAELGNAEAREEEFHKTLAERDAEVATLRTQLADITERSDGGSDDALNKPHEAAMGSHQGEPTAGSRGQPLSVRFLDGANRNFGGRTGQPSPDSGERTTPPALFKQFGSRCTFDACATPENALCKKFFTREQDGLKTSWPSGEVMWCNMPYGNIPPWLVKCVAYAEDGGEVFALLPAWTDMAWFHDLCPLGEIVFIRKRHKFGGSKGQSPFASIIVRFTRDSVRAGRQRQKQGDHTLSIRLDDGGEPPVKPAVPPPQGILTPPAIWEMLDRDFPGYTDICPYPRPPGYDALTLRKWPGKRIYANVPFRHENEPHGRGISAWTRFGIGQNRKYGTEIMFLLPVYNYVCELLEAGARIIPLGRVKFLDPVTKQPIHDPPCCALFVLPRR